MMDKPNWCIFWDDLLEKYNTIWDKVSADAKKEFDIDPVYNNFFFKTKIKFDGNEVTDFYDEKCPKVDSNHTCVSVISLVSALKKDGNYFLQVFLTIFRMDFFGAAHWWGRLPFCTLSLKYFTHILQWWNLAKLYLT